MKLSTRLALIAGAVIILATFLCCGLSFQMCRRTMLDQAVQKAAWESTEVFKDFERYSEKFEDQGFTAEQAIYYLKDQEDDYSILFWNEVPIYNQTVLDASALYQASLGSVGGYQCFHEGRRLVVFGCGWAMEGTPDMLHVVDITDTYLTLYRLAARMGAVSLAVAVPAVLALFWVLRRALVPLRALSEGARSIAAGAYGQRVPDTRRDELGGLGRDFNKMAQAVEEHIQEVEDSEEKKTLFMGSLTHELKTPLTAISGYAQTLRRTKLSEEDRETALDYIYLESKRLDRLSKKMLRLLELDQSVELSSEWISVPELAEEVKRICQPLAEARNVAVELGDCEGQIRGDYDLMVDALVNLVDNGIKASSPGGVVRLYATGEGIVVEDEGQGIPPEEIPRLTEPFYMVDKSRSRKSGGAGLGLALTGAILRRHGMSLRMESQVGQGTKATVFTI